MFCNQCGGKVSDSGKFCTNCGAPVGTQPGAAGGPPPQQITPLPYPVSRPPGSGMSSRQKLWIAIAVVVGVIVIAAAIAIPLAISNSNAHRTAPIEIDGENSYSPASESAAERTCKSNMRTVEAAVQTYMAMDPQERYPTSLQALVDAKVLKKVPTCPDGGSYQFIQASGTTPPYIKCSKHGTL